MHHLFFVYYLILVLFSHENNPPIESYTAEPVVLWNKIVFETAVKEDGLLTLKGIRTASMMHIAIHNALNAINKNFNPYAFTEEAADAHPIAAVTQAAFEVMVNQYPGKKNMLMTELSRNLDKIEDGNAKAEGVKLGIQSANKILKMRENDNWNAEAEYNFHPMGPGVYAEFNEHSGTPEGFVFGAGWAKAKPFMLEKQDQFRSPPPPVINSDEYTKSFNEVKEFGSFDSKERTPDQTNLAMWWKEFVENSHNRLARKLVKKENLNLWDTARLFALLNMSVFDAYISVFDNKFHYNHWRPYTAIRWAAFDGNPQTLPDTTWDNLHKHTYAFPSYPSAHGCASSAAMTILENAFGDNYAFEMRIPEVDKAGPMSEKIKMNPEKRSFDNFKQAAMECSLSRVYLGIHFRYDSLEGYKLGRKIGKYALEN